MGGNADGRPVSAAHLSEIPNHPVAVGALDLFHTVGVVKVPERVRLGADAGNYDLGLRPDLDRLNFHERAVGTNFGSVGDRLVHIPIAGAIESLNVSVPAGICLYEAVRHRTGLL